MTLYPSIFLAVETFIRTFCFKYYIKYPEISHLTTLYCERGLSRLGGVLSKIWKSVVKFL